MPLSNAAENFIKGYGARKFPSPGSPQKEQPEMGQNSWQSTATGQGQTPSRPKLLDMVQPAPIRDTEAEGKIASRSRLNALGRLLGSLGQLGGMAAGGDAVLLEDNSTPWLRQQTSIMDQDFRNQMGQYYNRIFQTAMQNNQTENQWAMRDDDRNFQKEVRAEDREFRREERKDDQNFRREERGAAQEFQERMQDKQFANQMKQLGVRNQQELNQAMWKVGINPSSPNAMKNFLERMGRQYEAGVEYNESRSTVNNNRGSGSGTRRLNLADPETIELFRRGREQEIARLRNEYNSLVRDPGEFSENTKMKEQRLKDVSEKIKQLETLKADLDNPLVYDLIEMGMNLPNGVDYTIGPQPEPGTTRPTQPKSQQGQPVAKPSQAEANRILSETGRQIQANRAKINSTNPDWALIDRLVQQAMKSGAFANDEEAFEAIIELAAGN